MNDEIAVIGGGVAGTTAAALLAHAGARVTLYEQHNVVGGCASFYQRDGYRFDVGATVVNGFGPHGIHSRIFAHLGVDLAAERVDPAMLVHLPDRTVARYGDERWIDERRRAFGDGAEPFWHKQEAIADRAWDFARRLPMLPVDAAGIRQLAKILRPQHLPLVALQGRSFASLLPADAGAALRHFVDLQLLITAQATAGDVDLTFGCTALDIAREGTYHLAGGIGTIATALARAARRAGARIVYNRRIEALRVRSGGGFELIDGDGQTMRAQRVIAAIPHENLLRLLGWPVPAHERCAQRWSAVTAYVGVPPGIVPSDAVLHHQILADAGKPLGEGNSAFVSISGEGDSERARSGGRAITISTHTDPAIWERAWNNGSSEQLIARYRERLLGAAARAIGRPLQPEIVEIGTPYTFERYTARYRGMVGGVPQRRSSANLLARSHRTGIPGLLLCGDTAFPGQSTVGVTLSAINAVRALGVTTDW